MSNASKVVIGNVDITKNYWSMHYVTMEGHIHIIDSVC